MHFGLALESLDKDLWNINFSDTHLDLLDTDFLSKHFVFPQNVFKISGKMTSRRLQDAFVEHDTTIIKGSTTIVALSRIRIWGRCLTMNSWMCH